MPARPTCPYCGATLSVGARYCDRCGTPLQTTSAETPTRRRGNLPRRVAVWVFLVSLLFMFAGGTAGGYFIKAGMFPAAPARPTAGTNWNPNYNTLPDVSREDPQAIAAYLRSVVTINAKGSRGERWGSGFIVDRKGHVVTAAHVVADSKGCVQVTDDNGVIHNGSILGVDATLDMALLLVPDLVDWPSSLEFTGPGSLSTGDAVLVLGTPRGVSHSVRLAATIDRFGVETTIQDKSYRNLTQLANATVMEGTSGGPVLLRSTGKVAGLMVASGAPAAVAWARPADDILPLVQEWSKREANLACRNEPTVATVSVTLATMTPRTGSYGVEGEELADGAELALREMNDALRAAGYNVTLRREDDGGSPAIAREKAAELARDPKVIGVVGSLESQTTAALAETLAASGVPVVAPTGGAEQLTTRGWSHFNRVVANNRRQEQVLASAAKDLLKVTSLYVVEDGSADAAQQVSAFKAAAQIIGLRIAGTQQVTGATDPVDLMQNLETAKADALYYAGSGEVALKLVRGLRQESVLLPVLGSDSLSDSRMRLLTGNGAQGVYFTRLTAEPNDTFRRRFESVWGKHTRGYAAYGYDAARVILEALVRYGQANNGKSPDRTELARLVRATQGHLGQTAWISFDRTGENHTAWVYLYEWRQGVPEFRAHLQ